MASRGRGRWVISRSLAEMGDQVESLGFGPGEAKMEHEKTAVLGRVGNLVFFFCCGMCAKGNQGGA